MTLILLVSLILGLGANAQDPSNEAAVDRLRSALADSYSHADRLGIDWNAELDSAETRLVRASSPDRFARVLKGVLEKAEDVHIMLDSGRGPWLAFDPDTKPNFSLDTVRARVDDWQEQSDTVYTGTIDGIIGYVLITSWSGDTAPAAEAIKGMHDFPAIIIDVRPNGGGNDSLAEPVARCFLEEPVVIELIELVDPSSPTGFSHKHKRPLAPEPNAEPYPGKTITLIGPVCCSSNETFIQMMRYGAGSTLVGETTFGASGNPRPHDLGNGVTVYLPTWRAFSPDGDPIEGVGIEPDIVIEWHNEPDADPVLDKAIQIARE